MSQFFQELKRRKVLKTLGIYAAAALIIIQVADIVFPRLLLPEWTVTFVIVLLILGFPITFFLSWTYDLKRENIMGDQSDNEAVETVKKWSLTKKILFPVTGFILMIVGGLFWFIYPFLTIGMSHDREYDAYIAILYMENMSSEENSYFADGLTEELINRLSRIQNLKVRPRTDVAVYKDKTLSLGDIAEELSVNYIVEGSVRISGNKLRVNVQLFDISQDQIIWSDSYDNKLKDIFDLQDDIASKIVTKLDEKLTISQTDIKATERKSTNNLEAYKLIKECYRLLGTPKLDSKIIANKTIPLAEKAILLDSTYADAYAVLAMSKFFKHENHETTNEAIKDANEAIILAEKALFYDPDNELALLETIVIPAFQIRAKKWAENEIGDLFTIRQLTIKMDHALRKFPDSPFLLAIGGMYFMIRYQITDDETSLDRGLTFALKSHSIIKDDFDRTEDFFIHSANEINFEIIPFSYMASGKSDQAAQFIIKNKNQICGDGTYECLNIWRLRDFSSVFYSNYYYDEALEVIELMLNRTDEELDDEGEDTHMKENFYWRTGMIHMKWAEYDKAIEGFKNALKINDEKDNLWWNVQYNKRLGLVYYFMEKYDKASEHYLQAYLDSKQIEGNIETIMSLCFHAYTEELRGNSQTALDEITECSEWVKQNPDDINSDDRALETYRPLYMYYNLKNDPIKTKEYLKLAYEIIGMEKIEKYHQHPDKDTHPEFFYCREIIKAYASSLNQ